MTTTAPKIQRDAWPKHPHYPQQTLLLASHENFRRISQSLITSASEGVALGLIRIQYNFWLSAMHSHEAYEERKLYPYLSKRWGASFADAQAGHHALHRAEDAVRSALADNNRQAVIAALKDYDEILRAHLALEEELVMPLLLSLSPEEFDHYYNASIDELFSETTT